MKRETELFLQAVLAALKNEPVDWDMDISREEWESILKTAEVHRILPMVYQAVYACPAARGADPELMRYYRLCAMQMVVLQTRKSAEFPTLLEALCAAGVEPLVVKGTICRRLYPNPDHRMSSDEDVLIPPENFALCNEVMNRMGLSTSDPKSDSYELPYSGPGSPLYIEIHRSLFAGDGASYGNWNRHFKDLRGRAVVIDGVPTLHPTDHMLYLLMHAFKHFLHSGFGLRQVCDMILLANRFGSQIDWEYVLDHCRMIRAEVFAAGLFRIGWKYLGFDLEQSRYPLQWQAIYVDEQPLLEDILASGVYGSADENRLHSSSLTLHAVSAQKQGKTGATGLLKTVFPSAKELESRYPYLKNKPLLLPVAWTDRLVKYGRSSNKASESVRIGNERIELLKKYGVLDKN